MISLLSYTDRIESSFKRKSVQLNCNSSYKEHTVRYIMILQLCNRSIHVHLKMVFSALQTDKLKMIINNDKNSLKTGIQHTVKDTKGTEPSFRFTEVSVRRGYTV